VPSGRRPELIRGVPPAKCTTSPQHDDESAPLKLDEALFEAIFQDFVAERSPK
jgi:hypothetical protein